MLTPTAQAICANNGAELCIGEGLYMGQHADGKFAHKVIIRLGGFRHVWRGTWSPGFRLALAHRQASASSNRRPGRSCVRRTSRPAGRFPLRRSRYSSKSYKPISSFSLNPSGRCGNVNERMLPATQPTRRCPNERSVRPIPISARRSR